MNRSARLSLALFALVAVPLIAQRAPTFSAPVPGAGAGPARADKRALTIPEYARWRAVTSVILDGAFFCSRAVLPHMVKNKYGRIINMGGVSTHLGAPAGRVHVSAGKAGIGNFEDIPLALETRGELAVGPQPGGREEAWEAQ